MKTKRTMKSIAAAALALSLVAVPAAQNAALTNGLSFGILVNAAEVEAGSAADLNAAIAAAEDGTVIKLTADISGDYIRIPNKNITLNLNGHTIAADPTYSIALWITGSSQVNITGDGKITGRTCLKGTSSIEIENCEIDVSGLSFPDEQKNAIEQNDNSVVTIKDGTKIKGQLFPQSNSTLNIEGGEITAVGAFAVTTNGATSKGVTVNITGGKIDGSGETAVYIPAGTFNIGGTTEITGATGVFVRGGTVNVTGGKITATGIKTDGNPQYAVNDGAAANGDAIVVANTGGGYGGAPNVTVSGGEIKSENGNAVGTYIAEESLESGNLSEDDKVTDIVSGGVFEGTFNDGVISSTTPEIEVTNAGGTKTVIGTSTINQILNGDNTITDVEIKQGWDDSITVPEGVTVTNSTGEDITVNGVVVADGEEADALDPEKFTQGSEGTAPTCTEKGEKPYYIYDNDTAKKYVKNDDGDYVPVNDERELEIAIDSTAHDYEGQPPAYTWSADNTSCTAEVVCKNDSSHILSIPGTVTEIVDTPATMEEDGEKHFSAEFTVPDGIEGVTLETQNTDRIVIPKLEYDPAKFTQGSEGTAPTCAAAGEKPYYFYDGDESKKFIMNSDGTFSPASEEDLIIPVDGNAHDYEGQLPAYTWSADNTSCTAEVVCKNDPSHILTIPGTVTEVVTKEPTAEEEGKKHYVATFEVPEGVTGVTLTDRESGDVVIPKLDPKPDDNKPDDNKPDDNKPDDNKPDDNKPDDNKPDDNKPDDNKPDDNKPDDNKPDDNKPDDNKPDDNKPDDNKPDDNKPDDNKPDDNKPGNDKPFIPGTAIPGNPDPTPTPTPGVSGGTTATVAVKPAPAPVVKPTYSVSFSGDYAGSGVTFKGDRTAGSVVTVNVPVGYYVSVISGGNCIAGIDEGTGTFIMPSGNVTLKVDSYLGAFAIAYANSYIFSYDSSMNHIKTNSVRGGMKGPEGVVTVKLGSDYAGRSVTLYRGRKSTSVKLDEAVLDSRGRADFTVESGKNYTLVVE